VAECAGTGLGRGRAYAGWRWGLLAVALLAAAVAWANGFRVLHATAKLRQNVYVLNARIDYSFSLAPLTALQNGVPLTVVLDIEIYHQRKWLWDLRIARLEQRYRLEYHALAQQYIVTNLNSGEQRSFQDWPVATAYLGRINNLPLLDASLLAGGERYYGRLRADLDIEALPAPLRPIAYLSKDWRLTSAWHTWPFP